MNNKQKIINYIMSQEGVNVEAISKDLNIPVNTIRPIVMELEQEGKIMITRGDAS